MADSFIRLTSEITTRVVDQMGGDHSIVAAAKVSTSGEAALEFAKPESAESSVGLINYLVKHRHGSCLEHSCVTLFVHTPACVWWEWTRHRCGFSFNLESGRYKKLDPVFWVPRRSRKMTPAAGHKSARPKFECVSDEVYEATIANMTSAYESNWSAYERMIADGIANEVARNVLGFGIYYSGWVTANPRSLMAFISLRTHDPNAAFVSYPLAEIEEPAHAAEEILNKYWPICYKAFVDNGRVGP